MENKGSYFLRLKETFAWKMKSFIQSIYVIDWYIVNQSSGNLYILEFHIIYKIIFCCVARFFPSFFKGFPRISCGVDCISVMVSILLFIIYFLAVSLTDLYDELVCTIGMGDSKMSLVAMFVSPCTAHKYWVSYEWLKWNNLIGLVNLW